MDYGTEIKNRLIELPAPLNEFVTTEKWRGEVLKIGNLNNLGEDKFISLENEVFLVLICLEPTTDFRENIMREAGLDENTARKISDSLNGSVFGPVMQYIKAAWSSEEAGEQSGGEIFSLGRKENAEPKENNIGDSFAQAIINQAKAMRPIGEVPNNLPTQTPQESKSVSPTQTPPTASQPRTNDPYREPLN
jgi:hypothetical protein